MRDRARGKAQHIGLGLMLLVVLVMCIYATYSTFTSRYPGANDFYPRWVGGCALLREGLNPYSEEATLRIQQGVYGRPALPTEDQVAFAYPIYSLVFLFPLCVIKDYALVQAIWLWLLLVALIAAVALWMHVITWQPGRGLWFLTVAWCIGMYHSFRALVLGQFAILVLLALIAAIWALQQEHDGRAGVFLALATVKPQLVYLAIPWILLWAAGRRRWRLWTGFGISMAALVAVPMLFVPSWLPDFVRQVVAYPDYTVYGSLTWMCSQHWLDLGPTAEIAALALLVMGAFVLIWRYWRGTWTQMLWALGVLVLLTNFFTPRIATTNYVLLIPYALWGLFCIHSTFERSGPLLVIGFEILSLVALWFVFLTTVRGDFEQAPAYLPFPVAVAFLLIFLWYAVIREPRSEAKGA